MAATKRNEDVKLKIEPVSGKPGLFRVTNAYEHKPDYFEEYPSVTGAQEQDESPPSQDIHRKPSS